MTVKTESQFEAHPEKGAVSALLLRPEAARWLYVFGHGAGVNMHHNSMETFSQALAAEGIATFRYHFPYMERGRGGMDSAAVRLATVRAAIAAAHESAPDLPMLAGGKSMGGRMTVEAQAEAKLPGVRGLVFLGFPLHPARKPSTTRAASLLAVQLPQLFLQGRRDALADLELLEPICREIGAALHVIDTADHGFKVLKSLGKSFTEVNAELAGVTATWAARLD
jgi:hypothetical protein